ncbi:hypothetical protein [Actinopolyspora halophila]|uniref:hypothetical protein n=1 Tax=Actinopolyspora halophila TaxID=1850 RepID=UPI00036B647B|nr:hypothetical protein [Actinopolyspora halophila]
MILDNTELHQRAADHVWDIGLPNRLAGYLERGLLELHATGREAYVAEKLARAILAMPTYDAPDREQVIDRAVEAYDVAWHQSSSDGNGPRRHRTAITTVIDGLAATGHLRGGGQ